VSLPNVEFNTVGAVVAKHCIEDNDLQDVNAYGPMLVTELGMVMEVREVQP
jgi:hypothetical protein